MSKTPKVRFAGFAEDWETYDLGTVAKYRNGKAHEGDIVEQGKYIVVNSKFVSTNGHVRKFSDKQIEPLFKNEIVFVLSDVPNGRAIARTYLVDEDDKYTLNQRIAGITPGENVAPYFLHILMNRNKYFLQFDDGAKQTNLSVSNVMKFEDCYPSKPEQYKIGACFEIIDHFITLHESEYEKLVALKAACLDKMFPKNGSKVPEIRFAGFSGDWEQRKLLYYADFYSGNGLSWNDVSEDGEQECILYGNLYTDYGMIADKVIFRTNSVVKNPVYSEFGDVLIPASDTTPTGLARATSVEKSGVLLGGDINIVRPKKGINGSCLSLAINTNKKELIKLIKGTTVRHIHNNEIKNIEVVMPKNKDEQQKLASYFKRIDQLINLQQCKVEKLKQFKQAMLHNMFV